MKRLTVVLLAILLCVSAVGCVESQRAQDSFAASSEGSMIGKTFQDVETAFGPFSMVYLEDGWTPMYLFSKTNVGFYFSHVGTPASWAAMQKNGTNLIPAAMALQSIRSSDVCTGVMGRISDFGIAEKEVSDLSQYLGVFEISHYDTAANTVYTVSTADSTLDVYLFIQKGSRSFTGDDQVRVMQAGLAGAANAAPAAMTSSRKLPQYAGADVTNVSKVAVGNLVTFGVFEQDNDFNNGAEPLQWRVLKKTGKRMLLITEKIIDARAFHSVYNGARWRNSDIRVWLNGEFLQNTFTSEERALIPEVELVDSGNDLYWVDPGRETKDRVFLLSSDDAWAVLPAKEDRVAQATAYANAQGFSQNPDGWWWLRNPGEDIAHAAIVYKAGDIFMQGDKVVREYIGVRPAIWVELP